MLQRIEVGVLRFYGDTHPAPPHRSELEGGGRGLLTVWGGGGGEGVKPVSHVLNIIMHYNQLIFRSCLRHYFS